MAHLQHHFFHEIMIKRSRQTAPQHIVTVLEARFGDVPGDDTIRRQLSFHCRGERE